MRNWTSPPTGSLTRCCPRWRGGRPRGVLMRHDAPLVAAMLAILKAGGIVVVLNQRIRRRVSNKLWKMRGPGASSRIRRTANWQPKSTGNHHFVVSSENNRRPGSRPGNQSCPEAIVFMIFTSGSTGGQRASCKPTAASSITCFASRWGCGCRRKIGFTLLASPSGGQGLSTLWCALLNGAALCPFPTVERGVTGLADWMKEGKLPCSFRRCPSSAISSAR